MLLWPKQSLRGGKYISGVLTAKVSVSDPHSNAIYRTFSPISHINGCIARGQGAAFKIIFTWILHGLKTRTTVVPSDPRFLRNTSRIPFTSLCSIRSIAAKPSHVPIVATPTSPMSLLTGPPFRHRIFEYRPTSVSM
jgi:hypothetical protein